MELILKEEDVVNVIKKHFPGTEDVEFQTKEDFKAILTISEQGALQAIRAKQPAPQAPPQEFVKSTPKVLTMGEGRGEHKRVMSARF